jgi:hypothetical protein
MNPGGRAARGLWEEGVISFCWKSYRVPGCHHRLIIEGFDSGGVLGYGIEDGIDDTGGGLVGASGNHSFGASAPE